MRFCLNEVKEGPELRERACHASCVALVPRAEAVYFSIALRRGPQVSVASHRSKLLNRDQMEFQWVMSIVIAPLRLGASSESEAIGSNINVARQKHQPG